MNLNQEPTVDQLRELLRGADDSKGHHVLWVDTNGEVRLQLIKDGTWLTRFNQQFPTVRLRFEAFARSTGHVGEEAANDTEFVSRYFDWLKKAWARAATQRPGEIFVDH